MSSGEPVADGQKSTVIHRRFYHSGSGRIWWTKSKCFMSPKTWLTSPIVWVNFQLGPGCNTVEKYYPKDHWTLSTGYFEDPNPAIQVQTLPLEGPRSLGYHHLDVDAFTNRKAVFQNLSTDSKRSSCCKHLEKHAMDVMMRMSILYDSRHKDVYTV